MSGTGTTTSTVISLVDTGRTSVTGRPPVRNRPTSSMGRTVADRPMRCAGRSRSASSRSSETARWAPRLLPATAWTSSTITVVMPLSISRALLVSSRNNDSGVVIRMSAPSLANARRSPDAVSPERTATEMSGMCMPLRAASDPIPISGDRRFRSTSTASAFKGDRYSTLHFRAPAAAGGSVTSASIAERKAARVLPEPVGATTRVFSPRPMASQAPVCAGVGSAKLLVNHSRTRGEKRARAATGECPDDPASWAAPRFTLTRPLCLFTPTVVRHRALSPSTDSIGALSSTTEFDPEVRFGRRLHSAPSSDNSLVSEPSLSYVGVHEVSRRPRRPHAGAAAT